jgi:hypothetical protein
VSAAPAPGSAATDAPTDAPADVDPRTPEERRNGIGWFRAILSGLGLLVVGIGVGVYGAQAAVEQLTGFSRDQRVWVATAIMTVSIIVMAWVLRRLQARGLI